MTQQTSEFSGSLLISTHTLTWSVTIDLNLAKPKTIISTHTLTWSVTKHCHCVVAEVTDFNSHAHVERDQKYGEQVNKYQISTHTLTWSVTALNGNYGGYPNISTHTLTWSVT